jgi:hypothetical protein
MRNPSARPAPCKAHSDTPLSSRRSGGNTSFLEWRRGWRAGGATPHRGHERGRARSRASGYTRFLCHCPGCRIRS